MPEKINEQGVASINGLPDLKLELAKLENNPNIALYRKKFRGLLFALGVISALVSGFVASKYKSYAIEKFLISKRENYGEKTKFVTSIMREKHTKAEIENILHNFSDILSNDGIGLKINRTDFDVDRSKLVPDIFLNKDNLSEDGGFQIEYGVRRGHACMKGCHDNNTSLLSYRENLSKNIDDIYNMSVGIFIICFGFLSSLGSYLLYKKRELFRIHMLLKRYMRLKTYPEQNINPLFSGAIIDGELHTDTINAGGDDLEARLHSAGPSVSQIILEKIPIKTLLEEYIGQNKKSPEYLITNGDETYKWYINGVLQCEEFNIYFSNLSEEIKIMSMLLSTEDQERLAVDEINIKGVSIALEHTSLDRGTRYGGDFLFVIHSFKKGVVKFILGDANQKGVNAALIVNEIRRIAFENKKIVNTDTPDLLLQTLNNNLRLRGGKFATCLAVQIDFNKGRMYLSSASHDLPVIVRPDGFDVIISGVGSEHLPIGIERRQLYQPLYVGGIQYDEYGNKYSNFQAGDKIIFCTDGITEAFNSEGTMFGKPDEIGSGFYKVLMENKELTADLIKEKIIEELKIWTGGKWSHDDVLLLIFEITSAYKVKLPAQRRPRDQAQATEVQKVVSG